MNQELTIKLTGPKTARDTSFLIRVSAERTYFAQIGSFRSDYGQKEFRSKEEFVKTLNKYLNVDGASVKRVWTGRNLFEAYYGGANVSREDMFLITRELIGDAAAIQLVNLIKF